MSDTETDGWCVSHDLYQDRPTKGTSDTRKPVRRIRTNASSTQQDTDTSEVKTKMISAIQTDRLKSSTDFPSE